MRMALVLSAWRAVGRCWRNPNSDSTRQIQMILEQAEDTVLYSAFVEDFETLFCFLHFHEAYMH